MGEKSQTHLFLFSVVHSLLYSYFFMTSYLFELWRQCQSQCHNFCVTNEFSRLNIILLHFISSYFAPSHLIIYWSLSTGRCGFYPVLHWQWSISPRCAQSVPLMKMNSLRFCSTLKIYHWWRLESFIGIFTINNLEIFSTLYVFLLLFYTPRVHFSKNDFRIFD